MSLGKGINVQEGIGKGRLVDFIGWNGAANNFAENAVCYQIRHLQACNVVGRVNYLTGISTR
jgi:hypothetical protein